MTGRHTAVTTATTTVVARYANATHGRAEVSTRSGPPRSRAAGERAAGERAGATGAVMCTGYEVVPALPPIRMPAPVRSRQPRGLDGPHVGGRGTAKGL